MKRRVMVTFPLPLFPPFILKVLLDFEGGNEAHGVGHGVWSSEKQVYEVWMEHGVLLSLQTHLNRRSESLVKVGITR
jgi:hypothetical protein